MKGQEEKKNFNRQWKQICKASTAKEKEKKTENKTKGG